MRAWQRWFCWMAIPLILLAAFGYVWNELRWSRFKEECLRRAGCPTGTMVPDVGCFAWNSIGDESKVHCTRDKTWIPFYWGGRIIRRTIIDLGDDTLSAGTTEYLEEHYRFDLYWIWYAWHCESYGGAGGLSKDSPEYATWLDQP